MKWVRKRTGRTRNNVTLKKQEKKKKDAGEETQRDRKVAASRVCWLLNTDNI